MCRVVFVKHRIRDVGYITSRIGFTSNVYLEVFDAENRLLGVVNKGGGQDLLSVPESWRRS